MIRIKMTKHKYIFLINDHDIAGLGRTIISCVSGLTNLCSIMIKFFTLIGAERENRTLTLLPARDFESRASTSSAIPAEISRKYINQ